MIHPKVSCFRLLRQEVWRAFSLAWAKTGKRIAARIAIMAITTSNSIRVKPLFFITYSYLLGKIARRTTVAGEEAAEWLPMTMTNTARDEALPGNKRKEYR